MTTMGLKAIGTAIAEQAKKAGREDAELTRLLAVEVAAKIMAKNCIMYKETGQSFYCPRCDAEHDSPKKIKHTATCPVLIINPIGDPK